MIEPGLAENTLPPSAGAAAAERAAAADESVAPPPAAATAADTAGPGGVLVASPPDAPTAPAPERCPNCGASLFGPYCAQCGQRAASRLLSVRAIVRDALEDQLSLDGSLPRTAAALLLHPGRLTREYVAGRIRSYIPPMRLYLTCSVIFFLVLGFLAGLDRPGGEIPVAPASTAASTAAGAGSGADTRAEPAAAPSPAGSGAGSAAAFPASSSPAGGRALSAAGRPGDSGQVVISFGSKPQAATRNRMHTSLQLDTAAGPKWLRDRLNAQARHLAGMPLRQRVRELVAGLLNAAPKVMFVLVPVFALLLKGLYVRRRRLYVEHFVFALHTHAAAFLGFAVMLLARSGIVSAVISAWLLFYFFHALHVVYGQGWWRTLAKLILLGGSYLVVVVAGIVAVALVAFLTV